MNQKPLAAVYCRVSSREQGASDKTSLADQRARCQERATFDGFEVPGALVFEDQLSGTLDESERPAFGRLMAAARRGEFARLYFWRVDRLGRDQAVIAGALRDLVKAGVEYVSVSEPDLSNPLLRAVLAGVAEHERQTILTRTQRGLEARRANRQWVSGMLPYGHRRGPGLTLEQCPDEAPVVRRIFELAGQGFGRVNIAKKLNTEGIAPAIAVLRVPGNDRAVRVRINTFGGVAGLLTHMEKIGAGWWRGEPRWSESVVDHITSNTIYYGESAGRPYTINPCPIISKTTFEAVNAAKTERHNKGANPRDNKLLSGLVVCGCCGRRYYPHQGGTKKTPRHYLFCRGRRTGACDAPALRLDAAGQEVVERVTLHLTKHLSHKRFHEFLMQHGRRKVDEAQVRLAEAQAELEQAETERRTLLDSILELRRLGLGDKDMEELAAKVKTLTPVIEARRRETDNLIAELGQMRATVAADDEEAREAAHMAESALWLDADIDAFGRQLFGDPRDVLQLVVRRIVVSREGQLSIELDESDDALARVVRHLSDVALKTLRRLEAMAAARGQADSAENVVDFELQRRLRLFVKAS